MTPLLWLSAALTLGSPTFELSAVDERPSREPSTQLDSELARLSALVEDEPRERQHRFALVRAQIDAGELEAALESAQAWREIDAYNLVVVRLIGDIQTELGMPAEALRTYSAVTELLSEDPEAQRALATVLKAQGDLDTAYARLQVAVSLRAEDPRLAFELADVAMRRGLLAEAQAGFERIVSDEETPAAVRHPAKQRLAQIYASHRREAEARSKTAETGPKTAEAGRWQALIDALELSGGSQNDIKIYLSWDTDRTDVDLWVHTPRDEKVFYSHRQGSAGGTLYDDVTTGYGPESFTANAALTGTYAVEVNYYGSGGAMKEARGEVIVIVNEGRADERQRSFPYALSKPGETVRVAEIEVQP